MVLSHRERHRTERIGWLRATVLGANDGIVSTASLVLGVAAAHATHGDVLVAGIAGLVAGAMSMAAGEYVSVHSQADTEQADLARERAELKLDAPGEHRELTAIYVERGLDPALAKQVVDQLTAHDAIGAHARDELGISETLSARPIQAALASASSFAVGATMPLLTAIFMAVLFKWGQVADALAGVKWAAVIGLASAVPAILYGWVTGIIDGERRREPGSRDALHHVPAKGTAKHPKRIEARRTCRHVFPFPSPRGDANLRQPELSVKIAWRPVLNGGRAG